MNLITYALSKKGIINVDGKQYKPELENGNIVYKEIEKPGIEKPGEYTTFILEDSLMKFEDSGEMGIVIVNTYENSIKELYINNTHVEHLPYSKLGDEQDFDPMEDMFPVDPSCIVKAKKGDQIKIKGSFSLYINAFAANDVNAVSISNVVLQNDLEDCSYMFAGINLTEAPKIPQNAKNCNFMFFMCITLTEAPVIPEGVTDCSGMFSGCIGLTTLPSENVDLMYNHNDGLEHSSCYSDCANIINPITIDDIPVDWGGNKVEEPVNEYTTFTVSEGTLNINNCDFYDGLIMTEWYIDGVQQSLPPEGGMAGSEAIECQVLDGQQIKIKGHFTLYYSDITSIDDLVLEDNLTNYYYMFGNCMNLTRINISNANTENVTNMSYMFVNCMNLTKLDLTSFDTSKVTNMSYMFIGCKNLVELDLSSFDTSNVTSKTNMFENVPSTCMIKVGSKWTLTESETGFTGTFTRV